MLNTLLIFTKHLWPFKCFGAIWFTLISIFQLLVGSRVEMSFDEFFLSTFINCSFTCVFIVYFIRLRSSIIGDTIAMCWLTLFIFSNNGFFITNGIFHIWNTWLTESYLYLECWVEIFLNIALIWQEFT